MVINGIISIRKRTIIYRISFREIKRICIGISEFAIGDEDTLEIDEVLCE
jgi:hypothetical protein